MKKELFGENSSYPNGDDRNEFKTEGYPGGVSSWTKGNKNTIMDLGQMKRILYGIGKPTLLRTAHDKNLITLIPQILIFPKLRSTLFADSVLGIDTANSWQDALDGGNSLNQHFREQVLFGPIVLKTFHFPGSHFKSLTWKVDPQWWTVELSKICEKYDAGIGPGHQAPTWHDQKKWPIRRTCGSKRLF